MSCQAGAHAGVVRECDNVEDIEDPCRCGGIGLVVLRGDADINGTCHEDEDDKEEGPERSRHGIMPSYQDQTPGDGNFLLRSVKLIVRIISGFKQYRLSNDSTSPHRNVVQCQGSVPDR